MATDVYVCYNKSGVITDCGPVLPSTFLDKPIYEGVHWLGNLAERWSKSSVEDLADGSTKQHFIRTADNQTDLITKLTAASGSYS